MRPETREKISRLAEHQATPSGEREAARAALERYRPEPRPATGSPEWAAALVAHKEVVGYCSIHRDLPSLTRDEVRLIRNFCKYGGTPWEDGAAELRRIAGKIRAASEPDDSPRRIRRAGGERLS